MCPVHLFYYYSFQAVGYYKRFYPFSLDSYVIASSAVLYMMSKLTSGCDNNDYEFWWRKQHNTR